MALNWRVSHDHIAQERATWLAKRIGRELRLARLASGMTQRRVATLTGSSQSAISRMELGVLPLDFELACRMAAVVGHEVGLGLYPAHGSSLRDRGQLGVAQQIVGELHPSWRAALEVGVGSGRDRRAVDLVLSRPEELVACEIERWLVDFGAQLRAHQLKREALAASEDRPVRLLLVVRDTDHNHGAIREHRQLLQRSGFTGGRHIWRCLREGRPLGADGLMFVRER
jgi:transcriptional regulator with XRE-family HTH domain